MRPLLHLIVLFALAFPFGEAAVRSTGEQVPSDAWIAHAGVGEGVGETTPSSHHGVLASAFPGPTTIGGGEGDDPPPRTPSLGGGAGSSARTAGLVPHGRVALLRVPAAVPASLLCFHANPSTAPPHRA